MTKQLSISEKPNSGRIYSLASRNKWKHKVASYGLKRERFYRPEFKYQNGKACVASVAYIKGYN